MILEPLWKKISQKPARARVQLCGRVCCGCSALISHMDRIPPHILSCGNFLPQLHIVNNMWNLLSTNTVLPISSVVETSFHSSTQEITIFFPQPQFFPYPQLWKHPSTEPHRQAITCGIFFPQPQFSSNPQLWKLTSTSTAPHRD